MQFGTGMTVATGIAATAAAVGGFAWAASTHVDFPEWDPTMPGAWEQDVSSTEKVAQTAYAVGGGLIGLGGLVFAGKFSNPDVGFGVLAVGTAASMGTLFGSTQAW